MIETDFGWALAKMRDGYKVRRKAWPEGGFIRLDYILLDADDTAHILTESGEELDGASIESVLAYDWELAE